MIIFKYEGKNYLVSNKAYDLDRVVLPDGQLLEVEGWKELHPPLPINLRPVNHRFQHLKPAFIAHQTNAALAHEGRRLILGEFEYLRPGDKVYYSAGVGTHHVEASAVVVSQPMVSIEIRIDQIDFQGVDVTNISSDCLIGASERELYRLQ